jgi:hypothetical protein
MDLKRFKFDHQLDLDADVVELPEEATNRQRELEGYVQNDGIVLSSPSLEPAVAEDLEENT